MTGGWIPDGGDPAYTVLSCPACDTIDIRVRTSRPAASIGASIVWMECNACRHAWKVAVQPVRALVVSLQSLP